MNKISTQRKNNLKCASKPCYTSYIICDNNLIAIRKSKVSLKMKKPTYIGMCIFELSKVLMHKFHYDYCKNKYVKKSKLFADIDSLMYEIKTEDQHIREIRTKKGFRILECLWDVVVISILKYVLK